MREVWEEAGATATVVDLLAVYNIPNQVKGGKKGGGGVAGMRVQKSGMLQKQVMFQVTGLKPIFVCYTGAGPISCMCLSLLRCARFLIFITRFMRLA